MAAPAVGAGAAVVLEDNEETLEAVVLDVNEEGLAVPNEDVLVLPDDRPDDSVDVRLRGEEAAVAVPAAERTADGAALNPRTRLRETALIEPIKVLIASSLR